MKTVFHFSSLSKWLPTPGSILFTLLIAALLLYTQRADALPGETVPDAPSATSTTTFPYQGRLTDSDGSPVNGTKTMTFRLYNVGSGGTALWQESWPNVTVINGLFNVLLGSNTSLGQTIFTENDNLWLGISVGGDSEMTPRIQVGSVPFARQATTTNETFFDFTLTGDVITTTTGIAEFGEINLSQASNLHIQSMWVLQNNVSSLGLRARLTIDGIHYGIYGDVVPLSAAGIGFTISRNHYVENLSPGNHTIGVQIDQFPTRSGDLIAIIQGSKMWIHATPIVP